MVLKQSFADGCRARCKIFRPLWWAYEKTEKEVPEILSLSWPFLPLTTSGLGGGKLGLGGNWGPRCAHFRWERPRSPGLPDLVLGHEVHALGLRGAHRFLRHGPWGSRFPRTLPLPGLSVKRRPGDLLPSNAGRGGGAAPGAGGATGLPLHPRAGAPPASAASEPFPHLAAHSLPTSLAPAAAAPPPSLWKTLGKRFHKS